MQRWQCPLHSRHRGEGKSGAGMSKKKKKTPQNAESLQEQPLKQTVEVKTDPVTLSHTGNSLQVQRLTAQSLPGPEGRARGGKVEGAEGSRQSTNPLLLLMLIIFLHSSTNLPFLPLFLSPPAFRAGELGKDVWWKSMKNFVQVLKRGGPGCIVPLWSIGKERGVLQPCLCWALGI